MQMVTVAIADTDPGRRKKLEQSLQGEQGIKVLTNVMSNGSDDIRQTPAQARTDIIEIEDVVARIGQLKPRILFVNLDESIGEILLCWRLCIASIPRRSWCY